MRRTLLLVVSAAVLSLLAACGGGSKSGSPTAAVGSTPGSATTTSGNNNGTINWEWPLPTSWDPVASSAGNDVHVLSLVYASITQLDAAGNAGPGLASSWKYASDGRSITFTLRPNLTFTDGTPIDATAVKENIERGQTQANSNIASELSIISGVVVDSPLTFTLNLSAVDYQIPDLLAGKDGMLVSPTAFQKSATAIATQPVGAGPFKLTSYVPDSHANLVRNPGYWDASDIHLASFTVQYITNPQEILAALESGQVNVAQIPGNLAASAKAAGFVIDSIPALPVLELDVQTTVKPFNDPRVVQAINYAINRQALVQVQESGYGAVSYQPFPRGYVGYNPALANLYPYNPAKAKQLLAAAGYAQGVTVTLSNPDGQLYEPIVEQIQSQLKQVGINAKINEVPVDQGTLFLYINKTLSFSMDGTAGRDSPLEMLDVLYDQKGLMDVIGKAATEPPAVAQALANVYAEPLDSPGYPAALQAAVKTAVTDDPIHIWLFNEPRLFAVSPKVQNLPFDLVEQAWTGVRVSG